MSALLEDMENRARELSARERGELVRRLLLSLEGEPDETPEAIARAWDEEIDRRVAEIDAGTAVLIPGEVVFAEIDAMLKQADR